MSVLTHLYANTPKYQAMLQDWMNQCTESEPPFDQLRSFIDPARMVDHTEIAEQQAGRTLVLIHHCADAATPQRSWYSEFRDFWWTPVYRLCGVIKIVSYGTTSAPGRVTPIEPVGIFTSNSAYPAWG
ncbi:hypothetical protein C8Q79DRAFT_1011774 [Trametes meyenii]|nr:hypothetical protein C8Q79DRAFT_1011774 [Trametes meyenii]